MKISSEKKEKISEHILATIFSNSPKSLFTSNIASEIARDEEFTKKILFELKKRGLVNQIKKNSSGEGYLRRSRWVLSDSAYKAYKDIRNKQV